MKNIPGRSAAAPMLVMGMIVRIFWGLAADYPAVYNASWICPLLAFALCLPFLFAVHRTAQLGKDSPWGNLCSVCPKPVMRAAEAFFALMLLFDCATSMRMLAGTSNVMALGELAVFVLLIPLGLLVFVSVLQGADAEGNSARIWFRVLGLLLAAVFIAHLQSFEPAWLTPILGSGLRDIAGGSIYAGGCITLMLLTWMVAVPDRCKKTALPYAAIAAVAAAALLAAFQMLSPPVAGIELSRSSRTELILSNGRTALSLQFLMIILWYGGLMHLIAIEVVTSAAYLHRLLPKAPQWLLAAVISVASTALGCSTLCSPPQCVEVFKYYFVAAGAALVLIMFCGLFRKGGKVCEG